mmetsp:Transcript_23264/g.41596  ORF Transcript_23264/g.41596 Transcript_23264/m.41596 type:complete len:1233 (+) Transcript_23264:4492-8190(+)
MMMMGDAMHLMQPILMDDDGDAGERNKIMMGESMLPGGGTSSAFTTATSSSSSFAGSSLPPPPPPPPQHPEMNIPEKVVRRQQQQQQKQRGKSEKPRTEHARILSMRDFSTSSRTGVSSAAVAKKNEKDNTQFEDEAELAILKALNGLNLRQSVIHHDEKSKRSLTPVEDDDDDDDDDGSSDNAEEEFPVAQVMSDPLTHRKDVSALTTVGFDASPKPPNNSRKLGENIFEDSAWTEEYDAAGRIDGTLPEEGVRLNPLGVPGGEVTSIAEGGGAAAAARPPLHPLPSTKNGNASQKTSNSISKRSVAKEDSKRAAAKEDGGSTTAPSRLKGDLNHVPVPNTAKDPTKNTGLRHRRNKTIAVKDMAEEMAQIAALHSVGGGMAHNGSNVMPNGGDAQQHRRGRTGMALQRDRDGGIGNLLAGLDILVQQEDGSKDADLGDKSAATGADAVGQAHGGNDGIGGDEDEETGYATDANATDRKSKHGKFRRHQTRSETLYHLRMWYRDLIRPKLSAFIKGATHTIIFIIVPLLSVAFILFYALGNPMAGGRTDVDDDLGLTENASWSWWVVFLVRQAFLLSCVKAGEVISIDILALRTPLFLKTIGSFPTLMIAQARGWPYVLTFWCIADFCFLFGNHQFARHWLHWQYWLDVFNEENPAGNFLQSSFYMRLLLSGLFVGVATSLKRLWIATYLGKRSYAHYGPELEIILAKMLLVSQIAHLARQLESQVAIHHVASGFAYTIRDGELALPGLTTDSEDEINPSITRSQSAHSSNSKSHRQGESSQNGFGQSLLDAGIGGKLVISLSRPRLDESPHKSSKKLLDSSAKLEIMLLLEEWEEPDIRTNAASKASIKDILQFRQAVSLMDDTFPFTPAFGPAKTRAMCVDSCEKLFHRLLGPDNTSPRLPFETISEIAYDFDHRLIRDKVKALIKLFRPDRKGFLTKLDFVSSIDDVYKDLRLFRASLANSSSIDNSLALIINIVFFLVAIIVILLIMGFKTWEPILSFSAFFFSFSFMFGPASSKYFEGILLIFIRRPYDIGDKIALSDPQQDTSTSGSSTWFVEKVSLFTTTVRFATTNEVATYSNGSLARLRIINAKRSPKAIVYVYMKFGSDVSYQMIKVYQTAIENFVKSRPREWAQLNGFRATRVEMELNYIEYVIAATHREMWQNVGPILQSKADLASFSLEVSKKLNLRYQNPPKPILLSLTKEKKASAQQPDGGNSEIQQVANMFGGSG